MTKFFEKEGEREMGSGCIWLVITGFVPKWKKKEEWEIEY